MHRALQATSCPSILIPISFFASLSRCTRPWHENRKAMETRNFPVLNCVTNPWKCLCGMLGFASHWFALDVARKKIAGKYCCAKSSSPGFRAAIFSLAVYFRSTSRGLNKRTKKNYSCAISLFLTLFWKWKSALTTPDTAVLYQHQLQSLQEEALCYLDWVNAFTRR